MGPELENEVVALYQAHAESLLRYARSLVRRPEDAFDALQETFLRYFTERSYGRQVDNPRAWLFRVLHNFALDSLDRAAVKREVAGQPVEELPGRNDSPEVMVLKAQAAQQIASSLTSRELECVLLRAEGLSYQEMADALKLSSGTIGALLNRVHKKLQDPRKTKHLPQIGAAETLAYLFR
jgi:RNA polymerase sigma-70 factor (ECF subfamily)